MKKYFILIWILFFAHIASGQKTVDYILKARAYTGSNKPDSAIEILTRALAENKDSRLLTERADARVIAGDYSGAISDYTEANKTTPFSGEYGLSRVYALKGDVSTSLYHLELNITSSFRKYEKEILLDKAFEFFEKKPEWRQFWKNEWYSLTDKGVSEIEYYLGSGNKDEAEELFAELKKNFPDNDDVFYAESLISYESGKYAETIRIIQELLTSDPGNEKYLKLLARAQTGALNPSGASATYTRILSLDIADAELFLLRAECFRKTGENENALADVMKYLDFYPENKAALRSAGKLEAILGDNLRAIGYFSKNIDLHPGDPDCYSDRADAYFVSKSWSLAISDYSMSLDLYPESSDVWLNKGIAQLKTGKKEEACHDFRKSLSLGNKRVAELISTNCIE